MLVLDTARYLSRYVLDRIHAPRHARNSGWNASQANLVVKTILDCVYQERERAIVATIAKQTPTMLSALSYTVQLAAKQQKGKKKKKKKNSEPMP